MNGRTCIKQTLQLAWILTSQVSIFFWWQSATTPILFLFSGALGCPNFSNLWQFFPSLYSSLPQSTYSLVTKHFACGHRKCSLILALGPSILVLAGDNTSLLDGFMDAPLSVSFFVFIVINYASRLNDQLSLVLIHVFHQFLSSELFRNFLCDKIFLC